MANAKIAVIVIGNARMGEEVVMPVRTIENCKLIKEYGTPNIYDGKCEGFGGEDADEPCEVCKECKLNTCYLDNE